MDNLDSSVSVREIVMYDVSYMLIVGVKLQDQSPKMWVRLELLSQDSTIPFRVKLHMAEKSRLSAPKPLLVDQAAVLERELVISVHESDKMDEQFCG